MSTKVERMAWNMTKLAAEVDPMDLEHLYVFEIGKDAGLALIDTEHIGCELSQKWVFVPQKEWDKAVEWCEHGKRLGVSDPKRRLRSVAEHWLKMSKLHQF